jgi:CAAX prenyl protease-like protein
MKQLREKFKASAAYARVAPFVIFLLLTFAPSLVHFEAAEYWGYLIKTLVGAWLIWEMRPFVQEMRWAISWEAIVVGILVFVMWVGIDPWYPHPKITGKMWNPNEQFGQGTGMAWLFMVVRIAGLSIVVPPLEEVFWRSFLYRWFVRTDFQNMPFNQFHVTSFLATSALFASEHHQWLAGLLCGFAYQGLVLRKNRIGDAITAHAITNFLLGVYVCWKGAWQFF